jgi:hypothetical protein
MSEPTCPDLAELLASRTGPRTEKHLAVCVRCNALFRSTTAELDPGRIEQSVEPPPPHGRAVRGEVALVSDSRGEELLTSIVLGGGDDVLTVVPVSSQTNLATEWDLLIPASVLGYPAAAQTWNFGTVLPEQVREVVATLDPTTFDAVTDLVLAAATTGAVPEGMTVGAPVLDDADPRLVVQDAQAEANRIFWAPAMALAGAATLGQLVHHRREELQVAAEDVEALGETRGWLADFERDSLDVRAVLPSHALAGLMRRLQIGASGKLRAIARATIEAQAPALARGESGRAIHQDLPNAAQYLDEFLSELENG